VHTYSVPSPGGLSSVQVPLATIGSSSAEAPKPPRAPPPTLRVTVTSLPLWANSTLLVSPGAPM
jgi:hypothetical protein